MKKKGNKTVIEILEKRIEEKEKQLKKSVDELGVDPRLLFYTWIEGYSGVDVMITREIIESDGAIWIVYKVGNKYFVTGDKLKWETGWKLNYLKSTLEKEYPIGSVFTELLNNSLKS